MVLLTRDVFDFARGEGRALLSENVSDFRPLAEVLLAAGDNHAGVVFTTEKRWPRSDPGSLITALERSLSRESEQPMDTELWL